jgi:hypothetical protein
MPNRLTSKPTRRAPAASTTTTRANPRNPGSASQQIRALQNTVQDVLKIHPGMSLPSINLIQGI